MRACQARIHDWVAYSTISVCCVTVGYKLTLRKFSFRTSALPKNSRHSCYCRSVRLRPRCLSISHSLGQLAATGKIRRRFRLFIFVFDFLHAHVLSVRRPSLFFVRVSVPVIVAAGEVTPHPAECMKEYRPGMLRFRNLSSRPERGSGCAKGNQCDANLPQSSPIRSTLAGTQA